MSKKTYNIALTHDELHYIYWAVTVAEALVEHKIEHAYEAASTFRDLPMDAAATDAFAHKFDAAHKQARIDDGETSLEDRNGVKH